MLTRKKYLNLINKSINALQKKMYSSKNHPMNKLTYQNIQALKKLVANARKPTNANTPFNHNTLNNGRFKIEFGILDSSHPALLGVNVFKRFPNGSSARYMANAINNGKPPNLNKLNVGLQYSRGTIPGQENKRVAAAIVIQRALRNKKVKGPFSSREMQNVLVKQILPKLPKKNREAVTSAFRAPSQLNKELRNRSKRVDPYWKALLNDIKRRSVMKRKINLMSG